MKKVRIVLPLMLIALVSISMKAQQKIGFVDLGKVADTLYSIDSTTYKLQLAKYEAQLEQNKIEVEAETKNKEKSKTIADTVETFKKLQTIISEYNDLDNQYKAGLAQLKPDYKHPKGTPRIDITKIDPLRSAKDSEKRKLEEQLKNSRIKLASIDEDLAKLVEKYQYLNSTSKDDDQIRNEAVQKATIEFLSDCSGQVAQAKGFTQIINQSPQIVVINLSPANSDITKDVVKIAVKNIKKFTQMYNAYYVQMAKEYEAQKLYYQQMQQMQQQGRGPSSGGGQ